MTYEEQKTEGDSKMSAVYFYKRTENTFCG